MTPRYLKLCALAASAFFLLLASVLSVPAGAHGPRTFISGRYEIRYWTEPEEPQPNELTTLFLEMKDLRSGETVRIHHPEYIFIAPSGEQSFLIGQIGLSQVTHTLPEIGEYQVKLNLFLFTGEIIPAEFTQPVGEQLFTPNPTTGTNPGLVNLTPLAVAAILSTVPKVASRVVHILGTVVWLGSLVYSIAILGPGLRHVAVETRRQTLRATLQRYVWIVTLAVGIVLITGITNADRHGISVLHPEALWQTIYGQVLSIKLVLVVGLLVSGGLGSVVVTPRILGLLRATSFGETEATQLSSLYRWLKRLTLLSILLGAGAVFLGSVVFTLHPV